MTREQPRQTLSLEQAYRAAFLLVDRYIALETDPDAGLVLFHQYLQSDPARWEDWCAAVHSSIVIDSQLDPLSENLDE